MPRLEADYFYGLWENLAHMGKPFNVRIDIKLIIQLCAKRTFCHRYLSCKIAKTTITSKM